MLCQLVPLFTVSINADVYKNELLSLSDWEPDGTPTGAAQAGVKAVMEALCALVPKFTEELKYLPEPKRQPSKTQFGKTTDARLKSLLTKTAESRFASTLQSIGTTAANAVLCILVEDAC